MAIRLHVENSALLRQAIEYTAGETGFAPRLIEKDYFCSVALEHLAAECAGLTFKGGTCLSKIHGGFYRLSEDLDFSIPTAVDSARGDRSRSAEPLRQALHRIEKRVPGLRVAEALRGFNNSTQYNAVLSYGSLLDGHTEPVSVEVGVREPSMTEAVHGAAGTLLLDPLDARPLVEAWPVRALSHKEAMAEKVRAALCRSEVAIRDFFDVDHAARNAGFNPLEPAFLDLLHRKIAIPRTGPVDVSAGRMEQLQRQLEAQLRPVLREQEFVRFDLDRAIGTVRAVALALG
ncbi:MAG: nucleotidyl transferase AbiEii/AbiGii toxin family protein [Betaproteobacteria bacterium]|nr:nucleotidyl transferase AbiEii/AbiGii toxin family protein [Betaproteobacteria bacterium]